MHTRSNILRAASHIPWALLLLGLTLAQGIAASAAPESQMVQTLRYGERRGCLDMERLSPANRWKLWLVGAAGRDCEEFATDLVAHLDGVGHASEVTTWDVW